MWVWRHRYAGARRARGRRLRAHLREPRGRGRRDAAPPARADLRLPVPASGAAARARRRRAPRRLRAVRAARAGSSRTGDGSCYENDGVVVLRPVCGPLGLRSPRGAARAPAEPARLRGRGAAPARGRPAGARARLRRAVRPAVPLRDGRPPGADRRLAVRAPPASLASRTRARGTCTSSSTRRCAPPRSSSTSPAPSRAPARSSPTCCPRSPPPCCARRSLVPRERSGAFAPGRVNLIGEHTDYNLGLALPFAIAEGVTVRAEAAPRGSPGEGRVYAYARDLDERDEFALAQPPRRARLARVRAGRRRRARARRRPARRRPPGDRRRPAARRRPVLLGGARGRAVPRACRPWVRRPRRG